MYTIQLLNEPSTVVLNLRQNTAEEKNKVVLRGSFSCAVFSLENNSNVNA